MKEEYQNYFMIFLIIIFCIVVYFNSKLFKTSLKDLFNNNNNNKPIVNGLLYLIIFLFIVIIFLYIYNYFNKGESIKNIKEKKDKKL